MWVLMSSDVGPTYCGQKGPVLCVRVSVCWET